MDNVHSNEKIAEALKLLEEAARDKKDELRTLLTTKYTQLKNVVVETEQSLAQQLAATKKRTLEAVSHAREVSEEKVKEVAHEVDRHVHEKPWPYIGGVAVVALLLGYILGRKRD